MKKFFWIISLVLLSFTLLPVKYYAADNLEFEDEINLYIGEIKIIPVNSPTRIAIGNPAVADVINVTKSELTLSPKAAGTTALVFWDIYGEQSYKLKVFAENIQEIKRRIDNLLTKLNLPGVRTQAEEEEGKVLLLGNVKSPQEREKIALVLGPLKDKTIDLIAVKEEETVVEIDVQVLELSKDATTTLGFTWPSNITLAERGSPGIATSSQTQVGTTSTISGGTAIGTEWSTLFKVLNLSRGAFSWTLDVLVQEGKARILSRPRLACQSGKEAELLVGGEKPIFTTTVASAGGEGTTVEYKEYGIKLKIKPTVTDDGRIKVALNVDISEVGTADTIGSSTSPTAKAYPLTKRNVATELYLDDGQTLAIGGLIKQKQEEDVVKTPWLGDIPILGALFRKKTTKTGGGSGERGNNELFITLTPKIVGKEGVIQPEEKPEKKEVVSEPSVKPAPVTSITEQLEPALPEPFKNYAGIIQKRILDNISYPASAKEAGFQGTVKLSLHFSNLGQLLDVLVKKSSGYKILDDNAVTVTRRIISYPPFPASIDKEELWVDIPIVYRLD